MIVHQDSSNQKTNKMKKYIYIFTCLLFVSGIATAQKGSLKRANKLFEMKAYKEAANIYETKDRSREVLQNLADSYYYNFQMQKAIKTYREFFVTHKDSIDIELYFRYAQALKGAREYKEADKWLSRYYAKPINTLAFIEENKKTTPHNYQHKQLENKNSSSDFGLVFYGEDKVAFASSRNSDNPSFVWNELPYLDLYNASITKNGTLENVKPFSGVINTDSHESNATFTKDGSTIYFNRTNKTRTKTGDNRVAHIKIYKAELVNGVWANDTALPFTSNKYSTEHPALSKDGKTLYFASDMDGGFGGFDIYKVAINDDGTYGEPENLGAKINTKHREQFPFISDDDVLYFSSIGHLGYGGLDVFRSNYVNGAFDKPVNLGSSINSNMDDFAYVIREKNNKGYFSSNRTGYDRLYGFGREENMLTKYQVEGVVTDKNSKELLVGSLVTLMDESGTVLQDTIVGNDATYLFKIEPNKKYNVRGTRKAYIPQDVQFSTDSEGKIQHDIELVLESYADAEAALIKEDVRGDVKINLDYNLDLSKRRAASTLEFIVKQGISRNRLRSIGYGEFQPLNQCTKEGICTDEEYDINRRSEFKILN